MSHVLTVGEIAEVWVGIDSVSSLPPGHWRLDFARSIEAAVLAKVLQARLSPAAWKCAKCSNVSDCEGVLPGDNWCNSCGAMDTMQPLHALKPAPMPNEGPSEGKL